ncbi:MAG: hypothetical protein AB1777_06355 [Bacteroidota bacterium]
MMKSSKNIPGVIIVEGHIQGLSNARALGKEGIPIVVIDKNNCIARYSKYCKKFFICPDYSSAEFIDFLIKLATEEKLTGWSILPSNDHAVFNISKNKRVLLEHYKIITPNLSIINNIYDKENLLKLAQRINIPTPKTFFNSSLNEIIENNEIIYPLITKGRFGLSFFKATGKKVFLSNSFVELQKNLNQIQQKIEIESTITQELIPDDGKNKTISLTAFCINGQIKTIWIGEKVREHPFRFGTATVARSIWNEEIIKSSISLLKELSYTGVCEIEYLFDPRTKKYLLIEINARTWLWVELAIKCGINYPLYIYNYLYNIPIDYPQNYKKDQIWVNPFTDIPFSIIALIKGQLKFKDFIKFYNRSTVYATFSSSDVLPSLMFFLLLPYIFLKRT